MKKVIFRSRSQEENPRWTAFHESYGFTPFYCEPGLRGAHEKGGVEGQVGYFRRNYLTPVPQVDSLNELNARFAEFEAEEDERRIGARMRTIAQDFAREVGHLLPLPDDRDVSVLIQHLPERVHHGGPRTAQVRATHGLNRDCSLAT